MGHKIEVGIQGVDDDANTRCSMKMAEANRWDTQLCWSTDWLAKEGANAQPLLLADTRELASAHLQAQAPGIAGPSLCFLVANRRLPTM